MASHQGDQESFEEDYGKEAVILRVGRPVLIIRNNETELVFEEAESEVWRDRLLNAKQQLSLSIPAIGRIELQNHPSLDWCGTGWLIDKDTVVTNRHVAELFGRNSGAGFTFRQGDDGKAMSASIDVLQEYNNPETRMYKLKKILYIEPEPGPDMAFLTVEPFGDDMPRHIVLAGKPATDQSDVAVIGYPAKDSRMPDVELMEKIFGNVFGKKAGAG
ncbi:trypsin-like serine peptidase [Paraflavitalea speifideaquila]|uniref:trypsin-like serine peptidase n=1 Tax=Paraflavitalea speifideaquila TaxID=3076558 RepID=UPI0028F0B121|nr:trypsin-like peptidase domain-containing protein [Paraflavitalea speifideiaquila]